MSNLIGIRMGGYVDENDKLMNRSELNKRIHGLKTELEITNKENERLSEQLKDAEIVIDTAIRNGENIVARYRMKYPKEGEK